MGFKGVLGKALPRDVEIKKAERGMADRLKKAS
jgi:hypothetical protein